MAFGKDQDPRIGKQFPEQDATKGGRKPSIKRQIKDLLQADGKMVFPAKQVLKINEDGSVVLKVPNQMQMAMKLFNWAMSKRGNDSLKAIQMVMEQVDGKPNQTIESKVELSSEKFTGFKFLVENDSSKKDS